MSGAHSPIDNQRGRTPLRRDAQQWVLDYVIQESGKVYHFQGDGRGELPKSVRSHPMISKHMGQQAQKIEALAKTELDGGHGATALEFYFKAAYSYGRAQHPIFELNAEKHFLYRGLRRCYDKVIELSPYPLIHMDIEWNDTLVSGILHVNPNVSGPAPTIFYIPGCDVFKEAYPHPFYNFAHHRGMHIFTFEGPGQPECNLRGIKLTSDNFEEAAVVALDALIARPEVDPDQLVLYSNSFGSFWGMRFAARERRFKAVAATQASLCDKYIQTDLESPRWKQLMAFLTQAKSEDELDRVMSEMTMDGYMGKISAPTLLTVGEYDPRAPLEEMYPLFDQMTAPAELWVMVDQHHNFGIGGGKGPGWANASMGVTADWLRDRLDGKPVDHPGEVLRVDGGKGPHHPGTPSQRTWYGED